MDVSRSNCYFTADVPQVFSGEDCTATPDSMNLKAIYAASALPRVSLQEAQLHWNACHGAMARQFVKMLPYRQYIQAMRHESKVLDEFRALLGDGFESLDGRIGHAEAWLDRRIVPTLQGPEVARMMGMLAEDISLFVDAKRGAVFVTKEHVVLSRPVITEPIPTLFDLD